MVRRPLRHSFTRRESSGPDAANGDAANGAISHCSVSHVGASWAMSAVLLLLGCSTEGKPATTATPNAPGSVTSTSDGATTTASTNPNPTSGAPTGAPAASDETVATETKPAATSEHESGATDPAVVTELPSETSPSDGPSDDVSTGSNVAPASSSSDAIPTGPGIDFDAYWDFEGAGDEAVDTSGKHVLRLNAAALDAGETGRYVALDGEGSGGSATTVPLDTSKDFSVSMWVELAALDGYDTFLGVDGEEVSAVFLQKRSDERLSFTTFPSDSTEADSCVATAEIQPRAGQWYHLVGTRNAATREQRIYVDGVLSGKTTCPGAVFAASSGVSVGSGVYGGESTDWMTGGVDELGFVSRVLTPAEVFDLYRTGRPSANHYLFAYFVEVSQGRGDGLRLAHSHDGEQWGAIGAGKVFMPPSVGGGSFRDPHVMRDPAGQYHLVWTTSCVPWAESNCVQDRGFGHATSADLVAWSKADYVTIDLDVEHVWAPETVFDAESEQYVVLWSSPLDQNPSASDPHSIYYLLTKDFKTFSEPLVLYSQTGRNFIDATISRQDDSYLMILKDEADGQKNLRALRSTSLFGAGAWQTAPSAPLTGNYAAEGPSLLERAGELFIYFDKYGEGKYGALRASADATLEQPNAWQDVSASVFFPGVRHGTPIEVPWDVYRAVAIKAGE